MSEPSQEEGSEEPDSDLVKKRGFVCSCKVKLEK